MPEIGTSGSMSGDGKRGDGHWPQATAPILDSTEATRAARGESAPASKADLPVRARHRILYEMRQVFRVSATHLCPYPPFSRGVLFS